MRHHRLLLACLTLHFAVFPMFAQSPPESVQADLYFPQFANGGPTSGQWQTTFTFANPNSSSAFCTLYLLSDNGQPLQLNFGSGPVSQVSFSAAPYGTATFQSVVSSSTIITGWAETFCTRST